MKTGFSNSQHDEVDSQDRYAQAMIDVCRPVFEQAVVLAGKYAKACGRDILLVEDFQLAMKFCVMHRVGESMETLFPEIDMEDDVSDEEDEELEFEDDEDEAWTPYTGDDPLLKRVTEASSEYESWTPSNPAQEFLKSSLDAHEIE